MELRVCCSKNLSVFSFFLPSKLKPMACFELKTPALAAFIPLHPLELSLFARLQVREKTAWCLLFCLLLLVTSLPLDCFANSGLVQIWYIFLIADPCFWLADVACGNRNYGVMCNRGGPIIFCKFMCFRHFLCVEFALIDVWQSCINFNTSRTFFPVTCIV